ncbi:MAG: tRNA (guanosine(37)-N1)-methyltransferase TrmD [Candidatus Spechtbacteria bacterium]|nr:tRNA (guanosine(37)-N1)-methyltransferase TrmD [Candidatus Spechtbacteria bacterium]
MPHLHFDILTLFPEIFGGYFNASILKRAQEKGIIEIATYNVRDFAVDKHRTADDKPYGGGAGMVMLADPILKAFDSIVGDARSKKTKVVVLSAKGKPFNQKTAYSWAKKYDRIVFVSGRYEGIDERVKKVLRAEEVSIGPYVLTDGDVAIMTIVSAVARLVPGVIRLESLEEESHWNNLLKKEKDAKQEELLEYPHYTRPEILEYKGKKYRVPKVLLSGDHKKIAAWREARRRSS